MIRLEVDWYEQPSWWTNFKVGCRARSLGDRLLDYGATWTSDLEIDIIYIDFENDADATAFLLRWS